MKEVEPAPQPENGNEPGDWVAEKKGRATSYLVGVPFNEGEEHPDTETDPRIGVPVEYLEGGIIKHGICTGVREAVPLPVSNRNGRPTLPPYIEIDGELQIHPSRVIFRGDD
jgi:hypothetical protein